MENESIGNELRCRFEFVGEFDDEIEWDDCDYRGIRTKCSNVFLVRREAGSARKEKRADNQYAILLPRFDRREAAVIFFPGQHSIRSLD